MSNQERRREADAVTSLISDRIDMVEESGNETRNLLAKHIAECATMQRKVLIIGCVTFGWLVAHSPEAAKIFSKLAGLP